VETVQVFKARILGPAFSASCELEFRTMNTRKLLPATVKP
jgi:hypothetical protein